MEFHCVALILVKMIQTDVQLYLPVCMRVTSQYQFLSQSPNVVLLNARI
jgi:hypothetical protein